MVDLRRCRGRLPALPIPPIAEDEAAGTGRAPHRSRSRAEPRHLAWSPAPLRKEGRRGRWASPWRPTTSWTTCREPSWTEKGFDLLVANDAGDPEAGFEVETNRVTLLEPEGSERRWPFRCSPRTEVADRIVGRRSAELLRGRHGIGVTSADRRRPEVARLLLAQAPATAAGGTVRPTSSSRGFDRGEALALAREPVRTVLSAEGARSRPSRPRIAARGVGVTSSRPGPRWLRRRPGRLPPWLWSPTGSASPSPATTVGGGFEPGLRSGGPSPWS